MGKKVETKIFYFLGVSWRRRKWILCFNGWLGFQTCREIKSAACTRVNQLGLWGTVNPSLSSKLWALVGPSQPSINQEATVHDSINHGFETQSSAAAADHEI
ncbi:unnamed protein product [Linum trigynum]|uniref:Uncharacterized protein n=1 Tax=Linum trigynum TaxID=586398 RepID=A0AAV2D5S0_9ROSI